MSSHLQSRSSDVDIASVGASVRSWLNHQKLYASEEDPDQHRQKRLRRRPSASSLQHKGMSGAIGRDGDDESVASHSSARSLNFVLRDHPILQPTPPSSVAAKRRRSNSPSKRIRQRLEHATPGIKFVAPASSVDEPASVRDVKRCIMAAVERYIPKGLKVCLVRRFDSDVSREGVPFGSLRECI